MKHIRNIAIIAHVDHGKTTLVDGLLKQSGTISSHRELVERAMDSNPLERERGITILAKCTAIRWNDYAINIVDTPGHADFGGEVERVLKMVDSVLLLVDAFEGPMPQTKFVLRKALLLGHRPIVVINKVDRPNARPDDVLNMVFDLFVDLEASEAQLDFPVIYASGKNGWAINELTDTPKDLQPLFQLIVDKVPPPTGNVEATLQMQIATLNYDDYLGRVAIGRVFNGRIKVGDRVMLCHRDGSQEASRVTKLWGFRGLERVERQEAGAGDIVAVTGFHSILPGETLTDINNPMPLPLIEIDEPTLSMIFMINDSPFAGREGKFVTSRQIRERLERELEHNVSLRVEPTERAEAFKVSGRGELGLSILLETMRREGYELQVSRPQVIFRTAEDGTKLEPIEEVVVEVENDYASTVIMKLTQRRGTVTGIHMNNDNTQRINLLVPSRGLLGYRSEFMTDTRGTGVLYTNFNSYQPHKGDLPFQRNGALIVLEEGDTTAYALYTLQDRGKLFVGAGEQVYPGQIIGEHNRDNDLVVNPCKKKQLTNMRAAGADEALTLTPHIVMTLERAIEFIEDDEYVEITPTSIRLRKAVLDHSKRKRA
jgi:GTP-binding protein